MTFYTHMPFIFTYNDNKYLLCGGNTGGPWKAYWSPLEVWAPRHIPTGASDSAVECAPAAFLENGLIQLSVVIDYRLTRFEGSSLDTLRRISADSEQFTGAVVTPDYILRGNRERILMADRNDRACGEIDTTRFAPAEMKIVRLSFVPEDLDKIIVTFQAPTLGERSILYSLKQDRAWRIQVAGQDVYKCAITDNHLYYATGKTERRVVVGVADFDLIPI